MIIYYTGRIRSHYIVYMYNSSETHKRYCPTFQAPPKDHCGHSCASCIRNVLTAALLYSSSTEFLPKVKDMIKLNWCKVFIFGR